MYLFGAEEFWRYGGELRFQFRRKKLRDLYSDEKGSKEYSEEVVDRFFEVMSAIKAAADERDLRAMKSLCLEELSGDEKDQYSMRLNQQWRLIVTFQRDEDGKYLSIEHISDYHS